MLFNDGAMSTRPNRLDSTHPLTHRLLAVMLKSLDTRGNVAGYALQPNHWECIGAQHSSAAKQYDATAVWQERCGSSAAVLHGLLTDVPALRQRMPQGCTGR